MNSARPRQVAIWCVAIFFLALAIRLALIWAHPPEVPGQEPVNIAKSLVTTGRYADAYGPQVGPTAHCAPLYPLLLSVLIRLFGTGSLGGFAMSVAGSVAASLAFAMLPAVAVANSIGLASGLLAGIAGALLPINYWTQTSGAFDAPYTAMLLVALCLLLGRTWTNATFTRTEGVAFGLTAGVGCLSNPVLIPVLAAWSLASALKFRRQWRRVLTFLAVGSVCALAVLSPWALRNRRALGSFIWTRSNFGLELQLSNNDVATADLERNVRMKQFKVNHPFTNENERDKVRKAGEVAYQYSKEREAFAWIASHQQKFLQLSVERFQLFWLPKMRRTSQTVFLSALTILGLTGLALLFVEGCASAWVLGLPLLAYPLAHYIIQVSPRYRFPIECLLYLLAAKACLLIAAKFGGSLQRLQRPPANLRMPSPLIAPEFLPRLFIQSRQQIERNIRRLIIRRIGPRNVGAQRTERRLARKSPNRFAGCESRRVPSSHQPRRDRFDVPLDSRNLTREKNIGARSQLQCRSQQRRTIDIGVPMHLPMPQKLGILQTRNHAKNPRLISKPHVILKADQVVTAGPRVFLPQLNHGIWPPAGTRIAQPHRLHGSEAQSFAAPPRDLFNGQTSFKKRSAVLRNMSRHGVAREQRVDKSFVLLFVERAVHVVVGPVQRLAITGCAKRDRHVDGFRVHNGADAVVEKQPLRARQSRNFVGKSGARERPARDYRNGPFGNKRHFFAAQFNERLVLDGLGNFRGENLPVHGQRVPARNARPLRGIEQQTPEPPQFFLQQPGSAVLLFGFQRIAADELSQMAGLMRFGRPQRPHLIKDGIESGAGDLPGRFTSCQAAPDYMYGNH